jgi:hypothetical protein
MGRPLPHFVFRIAAPAAMGLLMIGHIAELG